VPRDLADVLHYFLEDTPQPAPPQETGEVLLALAAAPSDVLRSAFAWNLTVELARSGTPATLVAPKSNGSEASWPDPQHAPPDTRLIEAPAADLASLGPVVESVAAGGPGRLVLVAVPPDWLCGAARPAWLRWLLLFTTPEASDIARTAQIARRVVASGNTRVGVTVHGVHGVAEAQRTFLDLARQTQQAERPALLSYGLIVDDLDVYRAIVRRSAVAVEQPHSRAARALRDVAHWIRQDALATEH